MSNGACRAGLPPLSDRLSLLEIRENVVPTGANMGANDSNGI